MPGRRDSILALLLLGWLGCVSAATPHVELRTGMGRIVIELYPDKAPRTVENFLQYVNEGFYDGTIFHRVIKGMDVVKRIAAVATGPGAPPHRDVPRKPVIIEKARVIPPGPLPARR
ncbi:MAG: peptidylprolyl isomerase [Betaproteobacteria bacterium]|nr:peptidylprolyl isomerase [Betaproteobacteria bacterium]